ncbi:hypothetical protein PTTG_27951 [Puccinia triticina 1-1 BBBD Race 1]|uniref:RING-type domain-containing protein n=1 Tax=Puccinia triticina (isolate 1-1 / race 1 (BBBD)) TaxID=630390 RepID=A0A180GG66_PUCT1|nr:hypothetical protein PTTG_27951 [Puccinia triticina 1-1 BBBD Race 1]
MIFGKVKMLVVLLQAALPISGLATGHNQLLITLDNPQLPNSVLENTADTVRNSATESLDPVLALIHPSNTVQRLRKRSVSESIKEAEDCSICYEPLRDGTPIKPWRECGHPLHKSCMDQWCFFAAEKASCPLCRCPSKAKLAWEEQSMNLARTTFVSRPGEATYAPTHHGGSGSLPFTSFAATHGPQTYAPPGSAPIQQGASFGEPISFAATDGPPAYAPPGSAVAPGVSSGFSTPQTPQMFSPPGSAVLQQGQSFGEPTYAPSHLISFAATHGPQMYAAPVSAMPSGLLDSHFGLSSALIQQGQLSELPKCHVSYSCLAA